MNAEEARLLVAQMQKEKAEKEAIQRAEKKKQEELARLQRIQDNSRIATQCVERLAKSFDHDVQDICNRGFYEMKVFIHRDSDGDDAVASQVLTEMKRLFPSFNMSVFTEPHYVDNLGYEQQVLGPPILIGYSHYLVVSWKP